MVLKGSASEQCLLLYNSWCMWELKFYVVVVSSSICITLREIESDLRQDLTMSSIPLWFLLAFLILCLIVTKNTKQRGFIGKQSHKVNGFNIQKVKGTVFAYGVTSSGKTHTMHTQGSNTLLELVRLPCSSMAWRICFGQERVALYLLVRLPETFTTVKAHYPDHCGDQKSPGIIPLAVKDVFSIIQETPGREFLLRVSYLEIYNEVSISLSSNLLTYALIHTVIFQCLLNILCTSAPWASTSR
eukprot:Gb_35639 [translate_table: standard]